MTKSCGIIAFRKVGAELEFLVGHPGGESWSNRDFWTLFKGCQNEDEEPKDTAIREFCEETGYKLSKQDINNMFYIGEVKQNNKKTVYAYAVYLPYINPEKCHSNLCDDGVTPEIDKYVWMKYNDVIKKTHPKHVVLYEKLKNIICDG